MTLSTQPAASGWKIIGQRQTQQLAPGAQFPVPGVDVTFITGHGVQGTVFVPMTQYNPDSVAALVATQAALADSVQTLTAPDQR